MREILFRGKTIPECIAWDEENQKELVTKPEWIYGGYGEIYGSSYIMTPPFMKHITAGGSRWMDEEIYAIRVQEGTVGQYTGLKDKEGNRIFEGDVVNCHFEIDGCDTRDDSLCCVVFVAGYWGLDNGVDRFPNALYDIGFELLIIGNIHDTPELLEDKK